MIIWKRTIKLGKKNYKCVEKVTYEEATKRYFYYAEIFAGRMHLGGNDSELITKEEAEKICTVKTD